MFPHASKAKKPKSTTSQGSQLGEWRACVGEGNCQCPNLPEEPGASSLKPRMTCNKATHFSRFQQEAVLLHYLTPKALPKGNSPGSLAWGWMGHTEIKARASSSGASGKCLFGQGREEKGLCSTLTHAGSFWAPAGCYYHWWHSAFSFPFSRATSAASFPVRQRWSRVDTGSCDPSTGKAVGRWTALALTVPTQAGLINSQSEELQIALQG